jgi:hypothetical protein
VSIEGLIGGALVVTITLIVIALPFLRRPGAPNADADAERARERLQLYYQRVLRNIRDLDEDHDLGKIPADDYTAEREGWIQRGAQALKALDDLNARALHLSAPDDMGLDRAIDDAIEAAVEKAKRA